MNSIEISTGIGYRVLIRSDYAKLESANFERKTYDPLYI